MIAALAAPFWTLSAACAVPSQDVLFVTLTETGAGSICGSLITALPGGFAVPQCALPGIINLPSGFTNDPVAGGGTGVLTYALPFAGPGAGLGAPQDFVLANSSFITPSGGIVFADPSDLIRFDGNGHVLFYSLAGGMDQVGMPADVAALPPPQTTPNPGGGPPIQLVTTVRESTEFCNVNNTPTLDVSDAQFVIGAGPGLVVEYHIISDIGACNPNVPSQFITGLSGPGPGILNPGIVPGPEFPPGFFLPADEPPNGALLLSAILGLMLARFPLRTRQIRS